MVSGVGATHFNGVNMEAILRGGGASAWSNILPAMEWTDGTTE